jgi:Secretion system C-terminal sorting domain
MRKYFVITSFLLLVSLNIHAQPVITSPMGGDEVIAGSSRTVSWNPKLVTGMLTLSLWDGGHGEWNIILSNVPSEEGKLDWAVPSNLQGNKFRVKLSTTGTVSGSALSRTFFSIVPPAAKNETQVAGMTSPILCTVHPNPAQLQTRICVEDLPAGVPTVFEIVSVTGQQVATLYNATPDAELGLCCTLDCSTLPSGTYFARIMNDNMGSSVKLVIQH